MKRMVLALLILLLIAIPVFAQEQTTPPDYTTGITDYLIKNAALIGALVWLITQGAKYVLPNAVMSAATIQAIVSIGAAIVYVVTQVMKDNQTIDLGTIISTVVTALIAFIVSGGLYDTAHKLPSRLTVLNGSQGSKPFSLILYDGKKSDG